MTIYRYEFLSADTLNKVNRLVTQGWKPSREVPLHSAETEGTAAALVVLERDETAPVALAPTLGKDVPLELLETVPLLDGLTHEELAELVSMATIRTLSAGEVIFEEGDAASCLCVILEGDVELRLTGAGSTGEEIMQIGPRDVFGESSFFSGGPHAAQAFGVTDVRLLVISRGGYDELLQASRPAAWRLAVNAAGILGVRLQDIAEPFVGSHHESLSDSLAAWYTRRSSTG
jgi:CRP-like cAMP-binding protein